MNDTTRKFGDARGNTSLHCSTPSAGVTVMFPKCVLQNKGLCDGIADYRQGATVPLARSLAPPITSE
jgi:hypothetical protein